MAEIIWTHEAREWLDSIYVFIAQDNPAAASHVIDGLIERVELLKDHPYLGHHFRNEAEGELRIIVYGHYRIVYLLKTGQIDIIGIFHGALDITRYIP